jgi:hypothetical protein
METLKFTCWKCNAIQEVPISVLGQEIRCMQCGAEFLVPPASQTRSGMQVIQVSENPLINVPWEVSRGNSLLCCHIVTSKFFYKSGGLKKDGTRRKSTKSKKIPVVRCIPEDIAEHIVEAHNAYMHF